MADGLMERYARCLNCGGAEGDHVLPNGSRAGFCRCGPERAPCKCPMWRAHPVARLKQALAADQRFEVVDVDGHLSVREREGEKASTGGAVPTCPDIKLPKVVRSGQE